MPEKAAKRMAVNAWMRKSPLFDMVIDFEAAVVDGWMPLEIRARLVAAMREEIAKLDTEGLRLPDIREGTVGHHARALGGASLPLSERFLIGAASLSGVS